MMRLVGTGMAGIALAAGIGLAVGGGMAALPSSFTNAWASDDVGETEYHGALSAELEAQIRSEASNMGFTVISLKRDDDEVEARASRQGRVWELEFDPATGRLIEAEEKGYAE